MSDNLMVYRDFVVDKGPCLCCIEDIEFKKSCSILSAIPIPVRFDSPEHVDCIEHLCYALNLIGNLIECDLIEKYEDSVEKYTNLYLSHIEITCVVNEEASDGTCDCSYTWDLITINEERDHGPRINYASGIDFYKVSELLQIAKSARCLRV